MKTYRYLIQILLSILTVSLTIVHAAELPAYDDEVNEKNAMALLKEYDPEGTYIVETGEAIRKSRGMKSNFAYWLTSRSHNAEALDTAVHEIYHDYGVFRSSWSKYGTDNSIGVETIYLGKEKGDVIINYLFADKQRFMTENYAKTLPEELRTFRYDTYVSENALADANRAGIYGLIDEYAAYHWGFNNQLSLYPYYRDCDQLYDFIYGCMSNYQAYEEFRFWMLGLLNYEKTHAKEQYQVHMSNIPLLKAYYELTMHYREMYETFWAYIKDADETVTQGKTYSQRTEETLDFYEIKKLETAGSAEELKAMEEEIFATVTGKAGDSIVMFRLYNPNSWEHFYTGNVKERDALIKAGWKYEGIGWYAPEESNTPVYRLYNPNNGGDHHYTKNKKEYDALCNVGWTGEGIRWFSDDKESVPVYREYNPGAAIRNHNYTANKKEHNALISFGWKDEGVGWFGMKH